MTWAILKTTNQRVGVLPKAADTRPGYRLIVIPIPTKLKHRHSNIPTRSNPLLGRMDYKLDFPLPICASLQIVKETKLRFERNNLFLPVVEKNE